MSTSVDQRMKGQGNQVSNGPKDSVNDEEFDSWRNQPHQSYSTPMSASSMADDQHSHSWRNQPHQSYSTPMSASSMADDQHSHYTEGMFGGGSFGGFNQPGFNYFPGNGDYSACGSSSRKPSSHAGYDDYYRDMYSGDQSDRSGLKPVEQGMQGLSILDRSDPKMVDVKVPLAIPSGKKVKKALRWRQYRNNKAFKIMEDKINEKKNISELLKSIVETKNAKIDEMERELTKEKKKLMDLEKDIQNLRQSNDFLREGNNLYNIYNDSLRIRINLFRDAHKSIPPQTYAKFVLQKNLVEKDDDLEKLKKQAKVMEEEMNHLMKCADEKAQRASANSSSNDSDGSNSGSASDSDSEEE